jgi:dipeptidyl aminopeptidase/acylaminoacyl peptidase
MTRQTPPRRKAPVALVLGATVLLLSGASLDAQQQRRTPASAQTAAVQNPAVQSPAVQSPAVQSPAVQSPAVQTADATLSPEVLWQLKRMGAPVASPDGRWVVAPVTRYTVSDDKSHTDLWLFAADGSVQRPLTQHASAAGQPTFSPDGRTLAFVARRDGDDAAQVYLLPVDAPGEARRLTEVPTGVSAPRWVGRHVYFISNVWPDASWDEMKEEMKRRRDSHVSAHTWSALPTSSWDRWLDETRQAHVFRIPAGGGAVQAVTLATGWELPRADQGRGSYDVAPDESLVAFVSDAQRSGVRPQLDIFLVRPGAAEARNITADNPAADGSPQFSPDGRLLAYTAQEIVGFYGDTRRLLLYDVSGGSRRQMAPGWDRSADGLAWAHDGSGLWGAIEDAGTRRIHFIPADGGAPRAVTQATDYHSIDVARNGLVVALNESFLYPPRLARLDPSSGATVRIDTINDGVLNGVRLGTYESVTYTGANGQPIQMWVHYPPDFDRRRQYPLFLLIHGGPHNGITDGFHFRWNAQTFASWGYVTAWHNFHGSSGFGQAFTDAINPDWMTLPYEDTRLAADWFASQPWIDADRMVAGGGSYGGYLSSILLGREHPFKALVIHAAVYNLYSQMAADFAVHSDRFGDYWESEIYREISPHYFADQFRTPALIIHGQLDYRVPVGQAFELFRTLQHRGIDSRLVYFPDENHWILKPNNSLYWYEQVRSWIGGYAPPGAR